LSIFAGFTMKTIHILLGTLLGLAGLFWACQPGTEPVATGFDRRAMLRHYADNLVKPAFTDLQTKTAALEAAVLALTAAPDAAKLTATQTAWLAAYESFLQTNAYNIGPTGEDGLRKALVEEVGTFPVSASKIEAVVVAGTFNFADFNRDSRGLTAVEYLLFDPVGGNTAVLTKLQAANRRAFLTAVVADVKKRVGEAVTGWNTYADTFVASTGTDAGSSTAVLYNEFVKSFEALKNFKVQLPLGKRPGQTAPEPTKAEGYYSGQTVRFWKIQMTAVENNWHGRNRTGQDGPGFREYLEAVEGGPALITATETQVRAVRTVLDPIPVEQSFPATLETLSTELQKQTRFYKSDMSSLLGIAITFSSGDGD
jgi:uncharacterized protein